MLHWPRFQGKGYHTIYHTNVCVIKPLLALPNSLAKRPITQTITHVLPATIFALTKKNEKKFFLMVLLLKYNVFQWFCLARAETSRNRMVLPRFSSYRNAAALEEYCGATLWSEFTSNAYGYFHCSGYPAHRLCMAPKPSYH